MSAGVSLCADQFGYPAGDAPLPASSRGPQRMPARCRCLGSAAGGCGGCRNPKSQSATRHRRGRGSQWSIGTKTQRSDTAEPSAHQPGPGHHDGARRRPADPHGYNYERPQYGAAGSAPGRRVDSSHWEPNVGARHENERAGKASRWNGWRRTGGDGAAWPWPAHGRRSPGTATTAPQRAARR